MNQSNSIRVAEKGPNSTSGTLPVDADGTLTIDYLKNVRRRVERITGDNSRSLGLHPVVYFYIRSGTFQPTVFLAVSGFLEELARGEKLIKFTKWRQMFEEYLIAHKEAASLAIKQLGSGSRHIPRLREYYHSIFAKLSAGKSLEQVHSEFLDDTNFAFLVVPRPDDARPRASSGQGAFSRGTKTAAFFAAALPQGARCSLCGALIHRNSVQFDHIVPRKRGSNGYDQRPSQPSVLQLRKGSFAGDESFCGGACWLVIVGLTADTAVPSISAVVLIMVSRFPAWSRGPQRRRQRLNAAGPISSHPPGGRGSSW